MLSFRNFFSWLKHFGNKDDLENWFDNQPKPPIQYPTTEYLKKPPELQSVDKSTIYFISNTNNVPKWLIFKCPCGCESVITLSMQKSHQPNWRFKKSKSKRATFYPSIWRDVGCFSHFWIRDGRVYWCHNTGTRPFYINK